MKILVIGSMHGDEPLGIQLVEKFKSSPVPNVDSVIANSLARDANQRFTGQDLNRSFPGDITASDYESKRAAELMELCSQYDVVLDFHNTYCPDNDCSFVGEDANQELFDVSSFFGLSRVIVADYDCINKYALNCISIEISMDSPANSTDVWYEKVSTLSQQASLPKSEDMQKFRFVYRITLEDRDAYALPSQGLAAFKPMDPTLAGKMGVRSPAYPIFVSDHFTQYNYGGLLNEL